MYKLKPLEKSSGFLKNNFAGLLAKLLTYEFYLL